MTTIERQGESLPHDPGAPGGAAAKNVINNTVLLVAAQGVSIFLSVLATPVFIAELGIDAYGLWTFVVALAGYAAVLDFGLGGSLSRFVASAAQKRDVAAMRHVVTLGLVVYLGLAVVLTPIAWFVGDWLFAFVSVPADLVGSARLILVLAVLSFCFAASVGVIGGLLTGLGLAWHASVASLIARVCFFVAAIWLLESGAGIYGLLAATFIQTGIAALLLGVDAHRMIGLVVTNPFRLSRQELRTLLSFSGWVQLGNIATLGNDQSDRVVIGLFSDVRSVGYYDLGNRLAMIVRMIPLTLLTPLLPVMTWAHEAKDNARFQTIYTDASRLLALMGFWLGGFLLAANADIVQVWLGGSYSEVRIVILILVPTFLVENLTGAGSVAALSRGQPRLVTEFATVAVTVNIAITILLAHFYGFYGVLLGTAIAGASSSAYFLARLRRARGVGLDHVVGRWLGRLILATLLASGVTYAVLASLPASLTNQRLTGLAVLFAMFAFYCVLLAVALRATRFFDEHDFVVLQRVLPRRIMRLGRTYPVRMLFGAR